MRSWMAKSTQSDARGREEVRGGAGHEGATEPDARRCTTNSARAGTRRCDGKEREGAEREGAAKRGIGEEHEGAEQEGTTRHGGGEGGDEEREDAAREGTTMHGDGEEREGVEQEGATGLGTGMMAEDPVVRILAAKVGQVDRGDVRCRCRAQMALRAANTGGARSVAVEGARARLHPR